ncbi:MULTISPECIES: hypothetical protein [Rodentibacter]|uniref:hypothetical protein n=1 Tax=Rodentibacter TaxID=1960084 RepID=UPI001CFF0F4F|nr:hypothetical protein [Rodentibacter sp. JRC1]GJI55879.1 hypothetical protein HEMROJRC1_09910 [Rodentibacter sp. JRC1]
MTSNEINVAINVPPYMTVEAYCALSGENQRTVEGRISNGDIRYPIMPKKSQKEKTLINTALMMVRAVKQEY